MSAQSQTRHPPQAGRLPAPNSGHLQFDNIVFAGDGTRCFWQAGFWLVEAAGLGFQGLTIFDGGLVSNVPTDGVPHKNAQTLVLPTVPCHTYVQPSRPIPASVWDYTNEAALQATFELGQSDAQALCASIT